MVKRQLHKVYAEKPPLEAKGKFKVIYETPPGESIIDMILFQGVIVVATTHNILKIDEKFKMTPIAVSTPFSEAAKGKKHESL